MELARKKEDKNLRKNVLKIEKHVVTLPWLHFIMDLLCQDTASHCSGCVAFKKAVCKYFLNKDVYFRLRLFCLLMFTNKTTPFLMTGCTEKYRPVVKDF